MARLLFTIWALMLNTLSLPIFPTCFANAMEDEDGEPLLTGPPVTAFLFAAGVYTLLVGSTLFPESFRKPKTVFLGIYEFLATAFFLEFATACVWTPIDVLVLTTLPKGICHVLNQFGLEDLAETFQAHKSAMAILTYVIATTFFLVGLHVTGAVDFTILSDYGVAPFLSYSKEKLWERLQSEFPQIGGEKNDYCRCKPRKRGRSKNRANNSR
ncbi:hypothetical protein KM043_014622 [Ampulex compressa]|nr:hypothetical protein KM043_014622 [Ampulex compressa]